MGSPKIDGNSNAAQAALDMLSGAAATAKPVSPPTGKPVQSTRDTEQAGAELSQKQLEKLAKEVQSALHDTSAVSLEFNVDKESGRMVVRVMDPETKELIRQIPSEEMLKVAKAVDYLQGVLIRQKA